MDSWRILIVWLLIWAASAAAAADGGRRQVLCLHSYHPAEWTDAITRGYRETLDPRQDVDLTIEYMDTKRREDAQYLEQLAELYRSKYANVTFSLILTSDDHAYGFALQRRHELFSGAPLVFCGVNRWQAVAADRPAGVTGVAEQADWHETLAVARRSRPWAKTIHVISDGTETAARNLADLRQAAGEQAIAVASGLDLQHLTTHLAGLPPQDFGIFIAYWRQPDGKAVSPDEMAVALRASSVPVFGRSEWAIGRGQLGGQCVSGLRQGRAAANLAARVLDGADIDTLPLVTDSSNVALFDWVELERHRIDPAVLPEGAEVINRPDPLLRIPRPLGLMAVACFVLLVALVIAMVVLTRVRRRALASTAMAAANLRSILHSMGDGVIATDVDGRITALNPVAEQLTGWPAGEAVGRLVEEVFRPAARADRQILEVPVRQALRSGTAQDDRHAILIGRTGGERHIADSCAPMRDQAGRTVGAVLVFRDISERFALEDRLRRAQTMEALGRMAGGIAHDFNNMLTSILGGAQLLRMRCSTDPELTRLTGYILTASERAAGLTAKLLTLARGSPAQSVSCDLHQCMAGAGSLLSHTLNRNIELVLEPAASSAWIPGDRGTIENALLNLCLNARDAMPSGGRVAMSCHDLAEPPPGCVAGSDGWVRLIVSDTGTGMDEATRHRVFEPFFTTKPTGKGTGLGLSMVYAAISELGGQVRIESAIGHGTRVIMDLPRCQPPAAVAVAAPPTSERSVGACILVVDDEAQALEIATIALTDAGHEVLTATDGTAGIAVFARERQRIRVVVVDMIMPRADGRACLAGIRALDPSVPVILVSGFISDRAASQGFDAVLTKPYRLDDLRQAVSRLLQRSPIGP